MRALSQVLDSDGSGAISFAELCCEMRKLVRASFRVRVSVGMDSSEGCMETQATRTTREPESEKKGMRERHVLKYADVYQCRRGSTSPYSPRSRPPLLRASLPPFLFFPPYLPPSRLCPRTFAEFQPANPYHRLRLQHHNAGVSVLVCVSLCVGLLVCVCACAFVCVQGFMQVQYSPYLPLQPLFYSLFLCFASQPLFLKFSQVLANKSNAVPGAAGPLFLLD